jgi:hypothetical protein
MTDTLKPGQKHPTPTKGFGDRVFYETLLRQNPKSEMAQEWCVAFGVLSKDEAGKLHKIVLKRKGKVAPSSSSSSSSTKKVKKERKLVKEEADDVGMDVGGSEGMGAVTM